MEQNKKKRSLKFSRENIEEMRARIEGGESQRHVAAAYGVSRSALQKRLKAASIPLTLGRFRSVFTEEDEEELAARCRDMTKLSSTRLSNEVIGYLAYQFANEKKLPHRFNDQRRVASRQWVASFRQRNNLYARPTKKMEGCKPDLTNSSQTDQQTLYHLADEECSGDRSQDSSNIDRHSTSGLQRTLNEQNLKAANSRFIRMEQNKSKRSLKFSRENIEEMRSRIEGGASQRQVASAYGINRSVLQKRLKTASNPSTRGSFTLKDEEELATRCRDMAKLSSARLSNEVIGSLAYQYANEKKLPHRFNDQRMAASRKWVAIFRQRHILYARPQRKMRRCTPDLTISSHSDQQKLSHLAAEECTGDRSQDSSYIEQPSPSTSGLQRSLNEQNLKTANLRLTLTEEFSDNDQDTLHPASIYSPQVSTKQESLFEQLFKGANPRKRIAAQKNQESAPQEDSVKAENNSEIVSDQDNYYPSAIACKSEGDSAHRRLNEHCFNTSMNLSDNSSDAQDSPSFQDKQSYQYILPDKENVVFIKEELQDSEIKEGEKELPTDFEETRDSFDEHEIFVKEEADFENDYDISSSLKDDFSMEESRNAFEQPSTSNYNPFQHSHLLDPDSNMEDDAKAAQYSSTSRESWPTPRKKRGNMNGVDKINSTHPDSKFEHQAKFWATELAEMPEEIADDAIRLINKVIYMAKNGKIMEHTRLIN